MWNIKNKEAVSPVIGVILMVAITVVLAAVLYVWVSGFMGAGGGGAPTAAFSNMATTNTSSFVNKTVVTKISSSIDDASCRWQLKDGNAITQASGTLTAKTTSEAATAFATTAAASSLSCCWVDNDGDSRLSTGDILYVQSTTTQPAIGWSLVIFDTSGNQIGYANYV